MTSNIDLQAIDRGLGVLAGLVQNAEQNADVRAIVAVFRADFEAASQQINVLGDYKELHDLLHEVQFKCYNYIASQTTRFPEDELVVDTLIDHGLTFKGLVAKLHDVAARATVSGELTWIAELVGAESLLEQALETKDPAMLKRHCRLVRRVLDRYPSLVNTRLNSAARALRMDAIERAMTTILDMLKSRVGESAEVTSFAAGTASLAELDQHLTCLVRDHDRWQDVDVELRRVEATLSSDPEELQMSWPDIKARTESLLCGQVQSQTQALRQESVSLRRHSRPTILRMSGDTSCVSRGRLPSISTGSMPNSICSVGNFEPSARRSRPWQRLWPRCPRNTRNRPKLASSIGQLRSGAST